MTELKFRAYQKTPSFAHKPGLYKVIGIDFYAGDYGGGGVYLLNKGEIWTEHIKDVVLEQYTGLTDKNGKEIYEGDIVLIGDEYAIVLYDETKASFMGQFYIGDKDRSIKQNDYIFDFCPNDIEVIGNIHEPPKDFRPEHLKRMGVSISKGGEE